MLDLGLRPPRADPTLSRVFAAISNNQEGWAAAMGDFISSVLPPGLIDVLSALIPPVVVGGTFCFLLIKLPRKEMAPRRMDGSLAGKDDTTEAVSDDKSAPGSEETEASEKASTAQDEEPTDSDSR